MSKKPRESSLRPQLTVPLLDTLSEGDLAGIGAQFSIENSLSIVDTNQSRYRSWPFFEILELTLLRQRFKPLK